jgi:hypothetical protein
VLPNGSIEVDWRSVDPDRYQQVVFVCGPSETARPFDEIVRVESYLDREKALKAAGLRA